MWRQGQGRAEASGGAGGGAVGDGGTAHAAGPLLLAAVWACGSSRLRRGQGAARPAAGAMRCRSGRCRSAPSATAACPAAAAPVAAATSTLAPGAPAAVLQQTPDARRIRRHTAAGSASVAAAVRGIAVAAFFAAVDAAQPDVSGEWGQTETQPLLDVMYLRCADETIDTTPVFNPEISEYKSTLDWKMQFFSVQAQPRGQAVIDNIHLCPQHADCEQQDQQIVKMDFSKNILIEPGNEVMYKFDVLLKGVVRSYTLIVNRLDGTETYIRELIMQSGTLHPPWSSYVYQYRSLLPVEMEVAQTELHLLDSGQTVLVSVEEPISLTDLDNITMLKNDRPGATRSPPTRLRLRRRLREEPYGEFQYPNVYADFSVPLGSRRMVHVEVLSADVGHRNSYILELARPKCPVSAPVFDADASLCVRFCNTGFYADERAGRCKTCHESCLSCLGISTCTTCPSGNGELLVVDNSTGLCVSAESHVWEAHREFAVAALLVAASTSIFVCGLCAFYCQPRERSMRLIEQSSREPRRGSRVGSIPGRKPMPGPQSQLQQASGTRLVSTPKPVNNGALYGYMPVRSDDSSLQ